jgi:catechol 2,3-dioxygenase-like lactoylglutathione lyase family enzyme
MPTRFTHIVVDAADPAAIARFWAELLGWPILLEEPDEVYLEDPTMGIVFVPVSEPKTGKNRVHLDLVSTSLEDQADIIAHAERLGARRIDIGQGDTKFVVLADPDGNEFCVLEPREMYTFTGAVAAIVLDCADPAAIAPFWSAAMGWPVGHRTPNSVSLRRPDGTGPWLELLRVPDVKQAKLRVHLDVAPFAGDDHAAEVARLIALGASTVDLGQGDVPWEVLADPEGSEFCVLSPRGEPAPTP